jgi:hypothetical protein
VAQQGVVARLEAVQAVRRQAVGDEGVGVAAVEAVHGVEEPQCADPFVSPQEVERRRADVVDRRLVFAEETPDFGRSLQHSHGSESLSLAVVLPLYATPATDLSQEGKSI